MVTKLQSPDKQDIIYPDDNGEPMSDNTEQFRLIVWIKENSELLFSNDPISNKLEGSRFCQYPFV